MKTPKEYTEMIKQKEVTTKLVGEVLYSLNKRAKNARDMEINSRKSKKRYSTESMEKYKETKKDIIEIKTIYWVFLNQNIFIGVKRESLIKG